MAFFESEEHEISVSLRHIVLLMTKARHNELANMGVSPQQIGVIRFIQKFQHPCTITELCQTMRRSNSSLVAIINRLERKGLVERRKGGGSRRFTLVTVTEKGVELYEKTSGLNAFKSIIDSLPEKDRKRLRTYLSIMIEAAEKTLAGQKKPRGKDDQKSCTGGAP